MPVSPQPPSPDRGALLLDPTAAVESVPSDGGSNPSVGGSDAAQEAAALKPRWFTPVRLLLVFCFVNIMVYLDRGVIASNGVNGSPRTPENPKGSGIQGEFNLTNAEDGLLATAFMVGLLVASPVFSEACKHFSAFRLIAIGMGTWAVAVAGCGLAVNWASLFAARMMVGVGEASFVALAIPFIDDYAPAASKAKWFACFYLCIPSGFALGYVYGGLVSAALGWRAAFFISGAAMAPFVVFMALSRPLHLHGTRDIGPDPTRPKTPVGIAKEFLADAWEVIKHPVWLLMTVGYVFYGAVIGVFAFWGPKAGRELFDMGATSADMWYGGVAAITGVLGGIGGGTALDLMGSTLRNANILCAISMVGGLLFSLVAFLTAKSFAVFMALLAVAELFLFLLQAPIGAIGIWSVPTALRPLGISLVTILMHLLGDVPSPPLLGLLKTKLSEGKSEAEAAQQWRVAFSIITLFLAPAAVLFLVNAKISGRARDYRPKEEKVLAAAKGERLRLSGSGARGSRGGGASGGGGGGGAVDSAQSSGAGGTPLLGSGSAGDVEVGANKPN